MLLALAGLSAGIRVRSYLLTRKIQAVLAGLQQLKVDATKEEELLRTVPFLIREPFDRIDDKHVLQYYRAELSNEGDYDRWAQWVPGWVQTHWPSKMWGDGPVPDKWSAMDGARKVAYVLGWRYLSFAASVTVLDGKVWKIAYWIEPDVLVGWPKEYLVTAHSTHGLWLVKHFPLPVNNTSDESPYYRFDAFANNFSWFHEEDALIGIVYTPDAPPEKVAHVYQVDLSCFWNFRGCHSSRQIVAQLWKDKQEIRAAAAARLASNDPCSTSVLAGRVRTLPDLNVALLEVVRTGSVADYRLKEVLLGHPQGPWTGIRNGRDIAANPALPTLPRVGERFLYFSGAAFDSCRMVPATPSAAGCNH